TSSLHTKNRFEYTCFIQRYGLTLTARYFLIQEHALGCVLSLTTTSEQPLPVTCYLIHHHVHNPFTSRLWEHGLYALKGPGECSAMLGLSSEGDVFAHGVRAADDTAFICGALGYAISLVETSQWAHCTLVALPHIT